MNSIKLLGSLVLAGAVATPIVIQQRAITELRDANSVLTEQTDTLATLRDELDRLRGQAIGPAELARLREDHRELLRLRGTLTAMRNELEDARQVDRAVPDSVEPPEEAEDPVVEPAILLEAKFLAIPRTSRLWGEFNLPTGGRGGTSLLSPERLQTFIETSETEHGIRIMMAPRIQTGRDMPASISQGQNEQVVVGYHDDGTPVLEQMTFGVQFNATARPFGTWDVLELELSGVQNEFLGYVNDDPETAQPIILTWNFSQPNVRINLGDSVVLSAKPSLNQTGTSLPRDHADVIAIVTPSLVVSKTEPYLPAGNSTSPRKIETTDK